MYLGSICGHHFQSDSDCSPLHKVIHNGNSRCNLKQNLLNFSNGIESFAINLRVLLRINILIQQNLLRAEKEVIKMAVVEKRRRYNYLYSEINRIFRRNETSMEDRYVKLDSYGSLLSLRLM